MAPPLTPGDVALLHHHTPLRILFVTLEFKVGAFSGNGVYAQSQVRALAAAGHDVHVVCGQPEEEPPEEKNIHIHRASTSCDGDVGGGAAVVGGAVDHRVDHDGKRHGTGTVWVTGLPLPRDTWGRLDHKSGWREFARAAGSNPSLADTIVSSFKPDVVLGVDWSSLPAWEALKPSFTSVSVSPPPPPYVYSNFRVYTRTDAAHTELEAHAVEAAAAVIALCPTDAEYITEKLSPAGTAVAPEIVLPPLREDVRRLVTVTATAATAAEKGTDYSTTKTASKDDVDDDAAPMKPWHWPYYYDTAADAASAAANAASDATSDPRPPLRRRRRPRRVFVTCCVRLSPEKEPERYVELIEELGRRGVLKRDVVVPLLCASTAGEYADGLKARFLMAAGPHGGVVVDEFLDAVALGEIYAASLINVHPCSYDAYGMTVVEAAAFGTPSAVQGGDRVGCTGLLSERDGEFVPVDLLTGVKQEPEMRAKTFADAVENLLRAGWNDVEEDGDDDDEEEEEEEEAKEWGIERTMKTNNTSRKRRPTKSLASIGGAASRRALAWNEAANAAAIADILRRTITASTAATSSSPHIGRWTLPDVEEQARLRPLWRDGVLALWVDGEWVVIQSVEAAPPSHPRDDEGGGVNKKVIIATGTSVTYPRYVVVTAYNPMGTLRSDAENMAAAKILAASCADMFPAPAAVFPSLSVDPVGGAEAWSEPGLALLLPESESEARQVRGAVVRLARRHGQAAVYELRKVVKSKEEEEEDSSGSEEWRLDVVPCFPGLEGLASREMPAVTRSVPAGIMLPASQEGEGAPEEL